MLTVLSFAHAQEPAPELDESEVPLTLGGWVETSWQWNFGDPENHVTNFRGFDDRHAAFTLQNVVLDALGEAGPVSTHVALQVGHTGATYYLAEPVWAATGGAGPSGPELWRYVQQATVAYRSPRGPTIDAGVHLSPIGPEGLAIKDQWNWSRSDLFFGLPFYHSGVRVTVPATERSTFAVHLVNGWNSVVDNNVSPSVAAQYVFAVPDRVTWSLLYFGGVERPPGAPEGRPWRHLVDTYVTVHPTDRLSTMLHLDGGVEPNELGRSGWAAGALYLRVQPHERVYLAARGDLFREWIPPGASPIFWAGSEWVASGTGTIDVRPADRLSVRVEYRRDQSEAPLYFAGGVETDAAGNAVPDATSQDTVTVGATAWF